MTAPIIPADLSLDAGAFFRRVARNWDLDTHHLRLLGLACYQLDRIAQARAAVQADGPFPIGRYGPRQHPGLAVERDATVVFCRVMREINLDEEGQAELRRRIGGRR